MLALDMIAQDTHNEFVAVGILDDDPAKRHLRYNGIRVLRTDRRHRRSVDRTGAGSSSLRSPICLPKLSRIASNLNPGRSRLRSCRTLGLRVGTPRPDAGTSQTCVIEASAMSASKDLIGRKPISTNIDDIASAITGKVVLVTGAGFHRLTAVPSGRPVRPGPTHHDRPGRIRPARH